MRTPRLATGLRGLAVALLIVWSLGPLAIGVTTSISTQREVNAIPTKWIPDDPTLDSYSALLGDSSASGGAALDTASDADAFGQAIVNTTILTVIATIAILVVAVMAGYGFSRLRFRGSNALLAVVLATMVIPVFTLVVALFRLMADFDLINTYLGLVLVFVSAQAPLAVWLFYNYCRELPADPEEAALIDGCTRLQAFGRVVLPQMRSGIAALTAITMLAIWGQFLIPLLLTSTIETKPVTVVITEFIGKYTTNYPLLTAAGVLAMIPPAVVALALNRHIRGMLSAGG
jgi:ABC-type glycerol-3-phosphate transport system permease component